MKTEGLVLVFETAQNQITQLYNSLTVIISPNTDSVARMTVQYHASTGTNMDIEESQILSKQCLRDGSSRRNSDIVLKNSSYRAATICLGLLCVLMLAGIIGQSIHYQKVEKKKQDNVKVIDKENLQLSQSQLETIISALNKNIEQLRASKSRLDTNYNVLSAATELLQKQNDTVVKPKDELQGSHDSVTRERDNLRNQLNNVTRSKEKLQMSYNDLIKKIEHLKERYNASTGEKDTLAKSHQRLTTERDALQETFNSLKKAADILRANYVSLAREKEELESNLNYVTAERDNLQDVVDKMNKTIQDKKCVNGWQKFECSCYYTSYGNRTWQKSREYCQSKGADLAIITSQNEMNFINGLFGHDTHTWIGLTDEGVEGVWKWVDGTPLTLAFWAAGQPNSYLGTDQDCGEFLHRASGKGEWNDETCTVEQKWICEMYLARVPATNVEEVGFMTYTSHQGVIQMIWLQFWGAVMLPIFYIQLMADQWMNLSNDSLKFELYKRSFTRSRASVAAPWITIFGSRIRGRNGGSIMAYSISCGLIVVVMADPVSRWHQIRAVDQDRGSGS